MIRRRRALLAIAALSVIACGSTPAPVLEPAGPFDDPLPRIDGPPHRIEYEAVLSPSLEHMDVRACFSTEPPARIRPGPLAARELLLSATVRDGDSWVPLPTDDVGILLPDADEDDCIAYRIDLGAVTVGRGRPMTARVGADLFATSGVWLWSPDDRRRVDATLRLELPRGIHAVLPFPRSRGGRYQLSDSAFRIVGFGAFGRFDPDRVTVPGGVLEVAWLDGAQPMRATRDELRGWLRRAAGATATLFGRFPVEHAALTVVPMPGAGRDGFGMVGRGGGSSLFLIVDPESTAEELDSSWVTVHEMSHLAAPYVRRRDAWLGEGIATYYQEVLRARGGLQQPDDAWRRLADGFRRGARSGSGRTLRSESAEVRSTHEFVRVYWGGAAIAFLVDVELRRVTNGRMSLDAAMVGLRACCSEAEEWSAADLIAAMDRATGQRVASRITARWLESTDFPDVSGAFATLGIQSTDDDVTIDASAGRALRDAIMSSR